MTLTEWAETYSPAIFFDENEPFRPVRIGVTLFERPGPSPSMEGRRIEFDPDEVKLAIEYAIYFDYDIGHLYELEHFWAYVGHDGSVVDAEASFHGRYFKALFKDKRNLEGTHVRIYSQPGKHAFAPSIDFLELIPNLHSASYEEAGNAGLLVPAMFEGRFAADAETDRKVNAYLQSVRFRPSLKFRRYSIDSELYATWPELEEEIPQRIGEIVRSL
ncbi:hypothetical protein [Cohnella zeiphila]|uniref:Uncharacterized protein n=1 Tax=Cohnella zeiphila TaxID=2761120 RepID=A0A7X0SPC1_9BACL|nr:hypothetical protein [Cohnella zeiphila]MBB6733700.1 hypothetical protein [Cohnella zeiphila]